MALLEAVVRPVLAAMIAAMPFAAAAQTQPRQIAPDIVAPPDLDPEDLTRQPPRDPLGELGQAGAKPRRVGKPETPKLFNPLATAAGVVEAKAITLTVAGIDVVAADQTCNKDGKNWSCGIRARTAFRAFLRGRALECDLPPDLTEGAVSARCVIGKQDVGGWLVANGWARPAAGGPYGEAGEKAMSAGKGIYGSPPDLAGLMPAPDPYAASTSDQTILDAPAAGDDAGAPAVVTPPVSPQGLY